MDRQLIETTYEMRKLDTSEKIESFDLSLIHISEPTRH